MVLGVVVFSFPLAYKQYINFKNKEIERQAQGQKLTTHFITSSGITVKGEPIWVDKDLLEYEYLLSELPKRIIIPSRSIDLPVKQARIVGDSWELSEDSASFGLGTAPPGKKGNTIIFAHAKWNLFRPLRGIKKGTKVYLLTERDWYLYQVKEIKTILPSQVEIIKPTADETLTLFTCSGFADTKRLIVIAKRVNN